MIQSSLPAQDYFDIIKNPIDLSCIKSKLEEGEYKNGWEVSIFYLCCSIFHILSPILCSFATISI